MLDVDESMAAAIFGGVIHVGIRGKDGKKVVGTVGPNGARSFADLLISLANEVDPETHYT
jgi:hypothetical protein